MGVYRLVWASMCGLVAALGLVAAFVLIPIATAAAPLFLMLALAAGLVTFVADAPADQQPGARRRAARHPLTVALAAGTGGVAVAGLIVLLGPAALLPLLIVVMASPPVVGWLSRDDVPQDGGRVPDRAAEGEIPTAVLCRQWQDSYEALRSASTVALRLQIVQAREQCLNELERRDPEGLSAWLASNASAASDPGRFLAGPH